MKKMNTSEMLKSLAEENQIRKILAILDDCKTVEEAREKIEALLK